MEKVSSVRLKVGARSERGRRVEMKSTMMCSMRDPRARLHLRCRKVPITNHAVPLNFSLVNSSGGDSSTEGLQSGPEETDLGDAGHLEISKPSSALAP